MNITNLNSQFPILNSQFSILNSQFPIPHSQFSILNSQFKMFNLAVLGGGPAGYTAAERAAQAGLNVVLFEKNALGGTCLNVGCIPTKTLLYSSKLYYNAVNGNKYGIKAEGVQFLSLIHI